MPTLQWFVRLADPRLTAVVDDLRGRLDAAGLRDGGDLRPDDLLSDDRRPDDRRPDDRRPDDRRLDDRRRAPGRADAVLVWADAPLPATTTDALLGLGVPLVLGGPTLEAADPEGRLAAAAGLDVGAATAVHDVRVRLGPDPGHGPRPARLQDHTHTGAAHLGEHLHVTDRVLRVEKATDDVEVALTADVGLTRHPVATWRPATRIAAWTLLARPQEFTSRSHLRMLLLTLRRAVGLPDPPAVRVGLLGYGAIGHEHNRAVHAVDGLVLTAVCDLSAERIEAARRYAPDARGHTVPERLIEDDEVDLVIVSTPPSSHATWALACLDAGKHVVVEKPFAIRTSEADTVLARAAAGGLLAGVYQNRRFDPDQLAIRAARDAGRLGDLFHLEAFVGGYGHPCNLWHSDAEVSGGAFYDWGAHVLDQLLDLVPDEIEYVTATEHKRVWLDVTNADHSRVTVRFRTGVEATFVYSDLAAALKPRWYVLGTRGAIVGHWRQERVVARSDIGTLAEDVLAPADSPPLLDLHSPDGSVTRLATPPAPPYAYHVELADRIQLGVEPTVTGAQSRRVLAVMEAASVSAREGGRPITPG